MFRQLSTQIITIHACLMLASCAAIKEQVATEPAGWAEQQQHRQQINNWEIRGRLGVQTEVTGGSMDIIWKQSLQDYSIYLIAPLGAGTYHIQGDDSYAEIRFPDGHKEGVDDTENVLSTVLEIELPVSAVKDWVRGLPASSLPVEKMRWNSQGLLETVKQSGWNVEMKKYTGSSTLLPHVIYLSRDDNAELDIRLALRQWLLDN